MVIVEVGLREFARRRGVSHMAVQRAIRDGRIDARREKRGKKLVYFIDPETADRQWNDRTDHTYRRSQTRAEKAGKGTIPDPVERLQQERGYHGRPAGSRAAGSGEPVQPGRASGSEYVIRPSQDGERNVRGENGGA